MRTLNNIFLILTLSLVFFQVEGQPALWNIEWGESQKTHHQIIRIVGEVDGKYYVLRGIPTPHLDRDYTAVNLQRIDADLRPGKKRELKLSYEGQRLDPETMYLIGGKLVAFASRRNAFRKSRDLFATEIDPEALTPMGEMKLVATVPRRNRFEEDRFDYKYSRDSSHFMILSRVRSNRREPVHFGIFVFDNTMNSTWTDQFVPTYPQERFTVVDFVPDRLGNVYLLGKLYEPQGKLRWRNRERYEYRVMTLLENGTKLEEYPIRVRDYFLSDLHLEVAPGGDLICAGFYSEHNTRSAKGTFYLTINAVTKEVETSSFYDFSVDFLAENLPSGKERRTRRRAASGRDVELYRYNIRDLIPRGDGGVVLAAEQYFVQTTNVRDPKTGAAIISESYHYNTILVVSVSPYGEIEWAAKIPKAQKTDYEKSVYASFSTMITNDHLYFIYNDHEKNITEQRVNRLRNFSLHDRRGIVAIASVDRNGDVQRQELLPLSDIETLTRPALCPQISPNEMILFGRQDQDFQFGRLVFE